MSPLLPRLAGSPFSTSFFLHQQRESVTTESIYHDQKKDANPSFEASSSSLSIVDSRGFRSIPPLRPTKINAREPVITQLVPGFHGTYGQLRALSCPTIFHIRDQWENRKRGLHRFRRTYVRIEIHLCRIFQLVVFDCRSILRFIDEQTYLKLYIDQATSVYVLI